MCGFRVPPTGLRDGIGWDRGVRSWGRNRRTVVRSASTEDSPFDSAANVPVIGVGHVVKAKLRVALIHKEIRGFPSLTERV